MDDRTRFLPDRLNYAPALRCLVDAHTILFGSRNPQDYAIAPGTCGKVDEGGRGCKPLISSKRVANEAIMGDGIIDGRGWVKLTGQTVSWWDLAQEAKVKNLNQNCPRLMILDHCDNFT